MLKSIQAVLNKLFKRNNKNVTPKQYQKKRLSQTQTYSRKINKIPRIWFNKKMLINWIQALWLVNQINKKIKESRRINKTILILPQKKTIFNQFHKIFNYQSHKPHCSMMREIHPKLITKDLIILRENWSLTLSLFNKLHKIINLLQNLVK